MARTKNGAIDATVTLPGVARRRGRPATGKAKTAAQRMREYRQRRQDQVNEFPSRVTQVHSGFDLIREFLSSLPPSRLASLRSGSYQSVLAPLSYDLWVRMDDFVSRVTENEGTK